MSCRRGHGTESVWSNQVTSAAEPLPQAPAPTGLRVSGTTATTITLAWTASADDGYGKMDGYNVTGGFDDEAEGHLFSWVAVPRHIAQESHTQRNLIEGRTYRFKVQAARDTVSTAPTSWVYATAGMPPLTHSSHSSHSSQSYRVGGDSSQCGFNSSQSYRVEGDSSQCGFDQPELETFGQGRDESLQCISLYSAAG